ncbi:MAG: GAF domain-containing protein, partial [Desulfobulbaceae bacterium]|nr:GAF domain-containing protein [Desulfobulbaceae bacterium]
MPKEKILIVEDERVVAMDIQNRLKDMGYFVCGLASSGEDAVNKASELQPDLVLMDIILKGEMDGIDAAGQIRERFNIPVVYLTAFSDEKTLQRARLTGPYGYILKPFDDSELRSNIEMALYKGVMDARIDRLNRIISAIRSVNQLIVKEKDPDRLIQDSCDSLIATRGFYNAWIALLDENEEFMATAEAGLGEAFLPMVERLKRGELTGCAKRARSKPDVVVIKDPTNTCSTGCPLAKGCHGRGAMSIRMEHGGRVYGLLTVSTPIDFITEQELSLFKEIAGDISFALHAIETEKERDLSEKGRRERTYELGERVKELSCLYGISELIETPDISLDEIYQGVVNLIPHSWQYSGSTCARIIMGNQEFRTNNFRETNWKQTEDIRVKGENNGIVEVFYLEEKPESDEGPFLKQERHLLNEIAERLGKVTERILAEKALQRSEFELRKRNRIANIFLTIPDEEMYGEVLQVILEAMESKHGVFGYIDEKENLVCPSMTRDIWVQCQIPDKEIVFSREKWGGIWGRALIEKKILYSNELLRVPEGHLPIHRVLVEPIIYQEKVIGLLIVANKPSDYDEKDLALQENLVGFIAPVLIARLQ